MIMTFNGCGSDDDDLKRRGGDEKEPEVL